MRIRGADKPRQSGSRVDCERFDRAVSAAEGMHVIRQKGVGATGLFTRARGRRQAWINRATDIRVLVADLVAARTAAGMTQQEVAMRMWTTKSAVSRLESGRYARPTLDTIEKYALAVGARVEIRVRPGG